MLEFIATRDHRLMRCVNGWRAPRWFRIWMIASTRGGDGWLWAALAVVVLAFAEQTRWRLFSLCGTSALTGVALFLVLKRTTCRQRPCAIAEHCWATLLPPDKFSFPSGHSITAFAISVPLGLVYPAFMLPLLFCAFSIAMSRVVLGMHFLSDVLAGILIGAGLGYISYAIHL
jgi:undecaprenyl-diphosphatase